jgi:hypothetical protein
MLSLPLLFPYQNLWIYFSSVQHVLHVPLISSNCSQYGINNEDFYYDVFFPYFSLIHPHINSCRNNYLYLRYDELCFLTLFSCVKRISMFIQHTQRVTLLINTEEKTVALFALSYFNFRYFNIKIVRKWRETRLVAHCLNTGWGNRNYIDLEIKCFSKEDVEVLSFLILHTTHTTTEAISPILNKKE